MSWGSSARANYRCRKMMGRHYRREWRKTHPLPRSASLGRTYSRGTSPHSSHTPSSAPPRPQRIWPETVGPKPDSLLLAENCASASGWVLCCTFFILLLALPFVSLANVGQYLLMAVLLLVLEFAIWSQCASRAQNTFDKEWERAVFLRQQDSPALAPDQAPAQVHYQAPQDAKGILLQKQRDEQREEEAWLDEEMRWRQAMKHGKFTPEDLERQAQLKEERLHQKQREQDEFFKARGEVTREARLREIELEVSQEWLHP